MAIYKLLSCGKDYMWGGGRLKEEYGKQFPGDVWAESWELSAHPDGEVMIASGHFEGATLPGRISAERAAGRNPVGFAWQGKDFPLLIKLIDTGADLSIQVHPNDAYAMEHEGEPGKTEMWLVLDCDEGACVCYGFSHAVTRAELAAAIDSGSLPDLLNIVPVKKGDVFFIEPGIVHAVGAGITLAEVQQSSNVAYRMFDYGRTGHDGRARPLHIEKAMDVINLTPPPKERNFGPHLCQCPAFTVDKITVRGDVFTAYASGVSFHHLLVLTGTGTLHGAGEELTFKKGDSIFVEAGSGTFTITGECDVLQTQLTPAKSEKKHYIGIDLGGTNLRAGVVNEENEILSIARRDTGAGRAAADIVKDMIDAVNQALTAVGLTTADCASLGVGCPGLTDPKAGTVVYTPNLRWEGEPLAAMLEEALDLPVYLSNDANCAALGEVCAGAAKGCTNAVMVTVGTGIGSGFVIDGKLFEGGGPGGAELGHTTLVAGGEVCGCGRKGCFEAYAAAPALARQAKQAARENPNSLLNELGGPALTLLDAAAVFEAANAGDKTAKAVLETYMAYLGEGLINVINLFRPQKVLLSGGVSASAATFLEPLNHYVQAGAFAGERVPIPKVEIASLGTDAGIIGAANLSRNLR
ncbi:ROK family protein [Ruminococcaceae bacterium OttesenSCG-928-N02]|nr:ROK family protein [Ruminococcaceae bacterium OttesenSCG-928-N02]